MEKGHPCTDRRIKRPSINGLTIDDVGRRKACVIPTPAIVTVGLALMEVALKTQTGRYRVRHLCGRFAENLYQINLLAIDDVIVTKAAATSAAAWG
jgi:hypothetical protein